MKISLLMPTLGNRPTLLAEAIDAIMAQSHGDWELLISVSKSSCGVINAHDDDRIKILWRPTDKISDGLNQCMEAATGDVFNVCADDDILLPEALATVAREMQAPWLVGRTQHGGGKCSFWELLNANSIPCPAVFWNRKTADRVGGFDPAAGYCFDYDYGLRCWQARGGPQFIPEVLVRYRDHPEQTTHVHAEEVRVHEACVRTRMTRRVIEEQGRSAAREPHPWLA